MYIPHKTMRWFYVCYLYLIGNIAQAQVSGTTCNCKDYLYLNDVPASGDLGYVHKFRIDANGTFTEIPNGTTNTTPWMPVGGGLPRPHGLGTDLNGNLYIGEREKGPIRRISCDGTLAPRTDTLVTSAPLLYAGAFNMVSRNNILYANMRGSDRIAAFDLCTMQEIGYVQLAGLPTGGIGLVPFSATSTQDWGFTIDKNGNFYATVGFFDSNPASSNLRGIYKFTPTSADFTAHTTYPITTPITNSTFLPTVVNGFSIWGIATDTSNNMYVVAENPSNTWILKYDSGGNFVSKLEELKSTPIGGVKGSRGIAYLSTTDKLYLGGGPSGDCVAIVNPNTMVYEGAALANVPGQSPKGVHLNVECCPSPATVTMDTVVCNATIGQKVYLRQLLSCKGTICEGSWTPNIQSGMTYNACDQSVTITANKACGEFVLQGTGGSGSVCGAFTVTLKLEAAVLTNVTIGAAQSVCSGQSALPLTITSGGTSSTHNVTYQWQKSTTGCNGTWIDIAGAGANTYTPTNVTQTTNYRLIVKTVSTCSSKNCKTISNCITITATKCPCTPLTAASITKSPTGNIGTGITLNLTGSATGVSAGSTSYSWTGTAGGTFSSTSVASPTWSSGTAGGYSFTVTITNTDGTGTCTITATNSTSVTADAGCSISSTITQSACNNNGTPTTIPKAIADDYFDITITASNGASTGTFEIVLNSTVIASGTYGTYVVVSGASGIFKADGTTTYTLTIRDQTTNSCNTTKTTNTVAHCSNSCPPQLCPIVSLQKQ